jgi:hypothetical protein
MVAAPLRAAAAVTLPADRAILSALVDLAAALEEDGAPAMIIGGIAVIVRGVPRQTVDVDATVWAEGSCGQGVTFETRGRTAPKRRGSRLSGAPHPSLRNGGHCRTPTTYIGAATERCACPRRHR